MKRSEDVMLLALKMEGATTYRMQVTTKKGQEILP